jgi:uncharacterized RDD family membrane protein YckC
MKIFGSSENAPKSHRLKRVSAFLVDLCVLWILTLLLENILSILDISKSPSIIYIYSVLVWFYFAFLNTQKIWLSGKKIFGIELKKSDNSKLTFFQNLGRYLLISLLVTYPLTQVIFESLILHLSLNCIYSFLMFSYLYLICFNRHGLLIHDVFFRTQVFKVDKKEPEFYEFVLTHKIALGIIFAGLFAFYSYQYYLFVNPDMFMFNKDLYAKLNQQPEFISIAPRYKQSNQQKKNKEMIFSLTTYVSPNSIPKDDIHKKYSQIFLKQNKKHLNNITNFESIICVKQPRYIIPKSKCSSLLHPVKFWENAKLSNDTKGESND